MTRRTYRRFAEREARLCVLRVVAEGNGTANDAVVKAALNHYGFRFGTEATRELLDWLEHRELVALRDLPEGVILITATERGLDVAAGRETHPDITPRREHEF